MRPALWLALLAVIPGSAAAGPERTLRRAASDFVHVLSAPARMSGEDALRLAAFAGVTAALIIQGDEDVERASRDHGDEFPYVVAREWSELGAWTGKRNRHVAYAWGGLTVTLLGLGAARDDDRFVETTWLMTESLLYSLFITVGIKFVTGRDRPYAQTGADSFDWFAFSSSRDHRAMPSGHAASAFAMMTTIARRHPHWWVQLPAYALATGVALERVDSWEHWASDSLVGGAIGYLVATTLVRRQEQSSGVRTTPFLGANRAGLVVSW